MITPIKISWYKITYLFTFQEKEYKIKVKTTKQWFNENVILEAKDNQLVIKNAEELCKKAKIEYAGQILEKINKKVPELCIF